MTLLYIIFSMVNYSVLIPLLEVLFDQVRTESIENIVKTENFEFSIQYIRNIFYSYFNEIIRLCDIHNKFDDEQRRKQMRK